MEEQVDKIRADISRVAEAKQKMGTLLKGMEDLKDVSQTIGANDDATKNDVRDTPATKEQHTQNGVWDVLERELGT